MWSACAVGGWRVADGLSDAEVLAFAEVFADAVSAAQLLDSLGWSRAGRPSWTGLTQPFSFWNEVSRLLAAGALAGGRGTLFAAAVRLFPENPVFLTGAAAAGVPGGGVVWEVAWPRNPLFTGREDELVTLRDRLAGVGVAAVLPVALHGLGGVGKTQLAVEYCYRFGREYELVWWVAAEESATALAGLVRLAERVGVAVPGVAEESARALVALLASGGRFARWLLVLDNAGVPEDLFGVLRAAGASGGHVLVTSRDHRWAGLARSVEVDVLPSVDAVAVLRSRIGLIGDEDAGRIVAALGNLPLAVEQAGAFLAANPMAPGRYADLLSSELRRLMSQGAPRGLRPVAATWTVTLHELGDPAVLMLARLLAQFGPEPVPLDLWRPEVAGLLPAPLDVLAADPVAWAETVGRVLALALARRVEDADAVVMHRLVVEVLRDDTPDELRLKLRTAACRLLARGHPVGRDRPEAWPRYAQLYAHVSAVGLVDDDDPDSRDMVNWLTRYLHDRGDYPTSHALAENVLARRREILGPDHPDTLSAAANLAGTLWSMGDYPAARGLEENVLARCREILGTDHPSTLSAAASLAGTLWSMGDYPAARGLEENVLARRREILGPDHPDTLTAAANLAETVKSQTINRTSAISNVIYASLCISLFATSNLSIGQSIGLLAPTLLIWPRTDHWKPLPYLGRIFAVWVALIAAGLCASASFWSEVRAGVLLVYVIELACWTAGYFRSRPIYRQYPGSKTANRPGRRSAKALVRLRSGRLSG